MLWLLWIAVALAFASAWRWPSGRRLRPVNPTAWALLASVALCLVLDWLGAEFDRHLWILIDLIVVASIVRRRSFWHMPKTDISVVALFPVAWMFYLLPDPWRYYGALSVVIAQLFATVPWVQVFARVKANFKNSDDWTSLDLMVAAT